MNIFTEIVLLTCCSGICIQAQNQEKTRKDDNFFAYPLKENLLSKGRINISFSVGFEEKRVNNDYLLTLLKIEEIKSRKYDLSIGGSYFVDDNVAVGGRLMYGFSDQTYHLDATILELLIDAHNYSTSTAQTTLAIGTGVRHFVPIGLGNKFFIFNETNLVYSYSQTLTRDIYNGTGIEKNYWQDNSIAIKLSPGLMYFLKEGFAFEFSLNPVSLGYEWGKVNHNEGESEGYSNDASLNFSIFPFNVYFGFSYYFK